MSVTYQSYISSPALAGSLNSGRINYFPPGNFDIKMNKNVWTESWKPERLRCSQDRRQRKEIGKI